MNSIDGRRSQIETIIIKRKMLDNTSQMGKFLEILKAIDRIAAEQMSFIRVLIDDKCISASFLHPLSNNYKRVNVKVTPNIKV